MSNPHLVDGDFQSDKYPTTPRGKVPLSTKDPSAQDLLWQYAQRRREVDGDFSDALEAALRGHGFVPPDECGTYTAPRHGWTCFHCGETFLGEQPAREHFGANPLAQPGCILKLEAGERGLLRKLRAAERELERYRAEDSDMDRKMHAQSADHAHALVREEEKGFARGVADARAHPPGHGEIIKPEQMPAPGAIVDYGKGNIGPAMFHYVGADDSVDMVRTAREHGLECAFVNMGNDLGSDHQLMVDYEEYGVDVGEILPQWQPTPPSGDGWLLCGKFETEDGPFAVFLRPAATPAESSAEA